MNRIWTVFSLGWLCVTPAVCFGQETASGEALPGTSRLEMKGDITEQLVEGVDRYLLRKLADSIEARTKHWQRDFSSPEKYTASIEPNRRRLAHILGVRDERVAFDSLELIGSTAQPALVGKGKGFTVYAVRWPVLVDPDPRRGTATIHGEGLLLLPTGRKPIADVIALPHCDHTPEQLAGLAAGLQPDAQLARRLAESGCRVIVPQLIGRGEQLSNLTQREWLYRPAFELGRHLIGYEVQKVLALVDWLERDAGRDGEPARIGLAGSRDGGMIALYAAALDPRIAATVVSGYFGPRQTIWQQPLDRNVFGLLREFGDAELAAMIAPRTLIVEFAPFREETLSGGRGAPAVLAHPTREAVELECQRANHLGYERMAGQPLVVSDDGRSNVLADLVVRLNAQFRSSDTSSSRPPEELRKNFNPAERLARQVEEIDRHNQQLLRESEYVRQTRFWDRLDYSSREAYQKSIEPFRREFREEVIGHFDDKLLPANPRTRAVAETEKWTRYEVVLDVFPDVIAYGLLIVPKGIKSEEQRPVVVCQHGLEGRPQDVVQGDHRAYHDFATRLAERGFITFAPQNLYIGKDKFRTLQRKANPLGKTLFSVIVPQHQQTTNWLASLPMVDRGRIAFYGLSYGGKSAMRIPPLVENYCLSICSADFNEWVDKNASTRTRYSYADKGEYEIFEFDLGSTFNYAEMAALIAPRPFMVERGHFDGVAADPTVAYEFAKVRHLYAAKLGLANRAEIEWFVGPHTINGTGTFEFLHKHLDWPR